MAQTPVCSLHLIVHKFAVTSTHAYLPVKTETDANYLEITSGPSYECLKFYIIVWGGMSTDSPS